MLFLVTGGTGFIGSHVVELLLKRGWEVVCPVRNLSSRRNLEGIAANVIPYDEMETVLRNISEPYYVIHMAGATRALDYSGYHEANVRLTKRLLEAIRGSGNSSKLRRFVLVSSQAAAGPSRDSRTYRVESDSPEPVSLYGRSKLDAEQVTLAAGLPVTIIRPSTVFGPRDADVLGVFRCARLRFAPCIAGPDRWVSIIYVEDLAEGIVSASLSAEAEGETYFMSNPDPVVWREFALQVARLMGYRAAALPVPVAIMRLAARAGDLTSRIRDVPSLLRSDKLQDVVQLAWLCSSEKAYSQLNWLPRVSLDEAIKRTALWYRDRGWL